MKRPRLARSVVHTTLWVDAAFELIAGATMLTLNASIADWLDVNRNLVVVAALIFIAAAIGIAAVALQPVPSRSVVSRLAALNLIGGAAVWFAVGLNWSQISPEGHWLVSAVADSFIAVAALEFLALRRSAPAAGSTG